MRTAVLILALLLLPQIVSCQALPVDRLTPPLPNKTARQIADVASWVTSIVPVVLDAKASWNAPERRRAFVLQGARIGVTYAAVFAVKKLVHRSRPCAPDDCGSDDPNFSFYSGHTALPFASMGAKPELGGPRLAVMVPLAVGTGGLRVMAGKHYLTDVLTAAGVGLLTSRIR